eukprot:408864-Pelagomonas_calceolata.AAC.1
MECCIGTAPADARAAGSTTPSPEILSCTCSRPLTQGQPSNMCGCRMARLMLKGTVDCRDTV